MSQGEKTKLDLVTAYVEFGDLDGARQLLQQLVEAGSAEAAKRLADLGSAPVSFREPPRPSSPRAEPPRPPSPRAEPPVNSGRPSVHIDENHSGGLILDEEECGAAILSGRPRKTVDITYWIVDGASGQLLSKEPFSSYRAAEEFVAQHFADRERWLPPVPSEEEHAQLLRMLEFMETEGANRWKRPGRSGCNLWAHLSHYLHQRTHRPDVAARITAVLEGNPYD